MFRFIPPFWNEGYSKKRMPKWKLKYFMKDNRHHQRYGHSPQNVFRSFQKVSTLLRGVEAVHRHVGNSTTCFTQHSMKINSTMMEEDGIVPWKMLMDSFHKVLGDNSIKDGQDASMDAGGQNGFLHVNWKEAGHLLLWKLRQASSMKIFYDYVQGSWQKV